MKILFTLILTLCLLQVKAQSDLMSAVFVNTKTCSYSLPHRTYFGKGQREFEKKFKLGRIKSSKLYGDCKNKFLSISKSDTSVYLNNTILEFIFHGDDARQVFDSLVTKSKKLDRDWMFDKGGRIYCLDSKKGSVSMITLNSCADGARFDELVKWLKTTGTFSGVLVISCGAYPKDVISF